MDYLYTGRCSILLDIAEDIIGVAKTLRMQYFIDLVTHELDVFTKWRKLKPNIHTSVIQKVEIFDDKEKLKMDLTESAKCHSNVTLTNQNGYSIHCHRCVLTARSDFFTGLFNDHFDEMKSKPNSYILHDISDTSMKCLELYVYSETILDELDNDEFVELLQLSDFYMLPGMKKVIAQAMANKLSTDNCLDWLKKGNTFSAMQFYC